MNAMAFDVSSVKKLLLSDLTKFTIFSANDCGYSGSTKDSSWRQRVLQSKLGKSYVLPLCRWILEMHCYWGWNSESNGCMRGCWPNWMFEVSSIYFGIQAETFSWWIYQEVQSLILCQRKSSDWRYWFLFDLCFYCSRDNSSSYAHPRNITEVETWTIRYLCCIHSCNLGGRKKLFMGIPLGLKKNG